MCKSISFLVSALVHIYLPRLTDIMKQVMPPSRLSCLSILNSTVAFCYILHVLISENPYLNLKNIIVLCEQAQTDQEFQG